MAKESTPQTIYRKDYREPDYTIDSVDLTFRIDDAVTMVSSVLRIQRLSDQPTPLALHGIGLGLQEIRLEGKKLAASEYQIDNTTLSLDNVPETFELSTTVALQPAENTALEACTSRGSSC